jgi:hypothetical protein
LDICSSFLLLDGYFLGAYPVLVSEQLFCGLELSFKCAGDCVCFKLQRFFAVPWQFWKEAREEWMRGGRGTSVPVKAYGWFWDTPGMASANAAQLHPDWEIKTGGTSGLPYLAIIERMKGERT